MKTGKYDENRLLHLLLDMGEMLLASGAEINRVEDTLQRIGRAYGAAKMNVFVITSSIVITMEKTMTLNLRVNPTVKQQAEDVLKQLGIPMATAIDMYLRQITLTGGIPFSLSLPKAPAALNADTMTDDQLHAALQVGIKEIQNGDTVDAASAFAQFREQHR